MFIRVRRTANGNTCYQLVRSYRDATGAVRQETVSVSAATVAESLDNARRDLRDCRYWRTKFEAQRDISWGKPNFEQNDRATEQAERRLAMLEEAQQQGVA